jgi:hypothetical protein
MPIHKNVVHDIIEFNIISMPSTNKNIFIYSEKNAPHAVHDPLNNSNEDMEKPILSHSVEYSNAHNPSLVNAKLPTKQLP